MSILKKFFQTCEKLTDKDVKYAKTSFALTGAGGAVISNTVGGAYLVALFSFMGATETQSNFIISLTNFTMLFGLLAPVLTRRAKAHKPFTYICRVLAYFAAGLIFLLPMITGVNFYSVVLGAILFFVFQAFMSLHTPTYNVWYMNAISADGKNPGFYLGSNTLVSFVAMIASMLLIAEFFKVFTGDRQIYFFIIMGVIVILLTVIIALMLLSTKEVPIAKRDEKTSSLKDFADMFRDKTFAPYLRANTLHLTSIALISALINTFTVQRLAIRLDIITYMCILDFALRGAFAPLCGKLMAKVGSRKILIAAYVLVAISHGIFAFMTTENFITLKIISSLFMGIGFACQNVANTKYMFEVMPPEKSTSYIAGSSALSGITGYFASLVTTFVIAIANGAQFSVFGITFSEMQFMFVISMVFSLVSVSYLFNKKTVA